MTWRIALSSDIARRVALVAAFLMALVAQQAVSAEPGTDRTIYDVLVTNRTSVAFTVTWRTDEASDGWLDYGQDPGLGQIAYDDRGADEASRVHHVTLGGLAAETIYHFRIHSGEAVSDQDGTPYQVTTKSAGPIPPHPTLAYGQVRTREDAPALGSLVRARSLEPGGRLSELRSTLVEDSGYWSVSLELLYCSGVQLQLHTMGSQGGEAQLTLPACNSHPAPAMVLDGAGGSSIYLPLVLQ